MKQKIRILFIIICNSLISTGNVAFSDPCSLAPDPGPCQAAIKRYYFNTETTTCREFIWGGCKGTVPFDTLNDCKKSCMDAINPEYLEKLDASLSGWKHVKNNNVQAYHYATNFSSWTGYKNETIIHVRNDIVISRQFRAWDQDRRSISQWIEKTPADLGTNKEGAPPKSVDELYEECREILLTKNLKENRLYRTHKPRS